MSRDGLLPSAMQKIHPTHRTPYVGTLVTGVIAAFFAGLFPLDILGELISIGILIAFAAVCAGVVVLRHLQPDTPRPFRVPFAHVTGVAGVVACFAMALSLPHDTWIRLVVWSALGILVYVFYGYRHSRLRQQG
jgi:APA family basic amino acid/polyamine antiporter